MRARIDDTNTACRFLLRYSEHLIQTIRPINHSRLLSSAAMMATLIS